MENGRIHYNGNLLSKRNYNNGTLQGLYINYYRIGQILSISNYKNNNLEGKFLSFYKNGLLQTKKNL